MPSKIATRGGFGLAAVTLAVCLQPQAASASTLTPLYSFCAQNNCTDGNMPLMPVLRDAAGNIFGTTLSDGATGGGTVFVLKKSHNKYKFQRIYLFCQQTNCTDGKEPSGSLIADVNGNVYGAVKKGGKHGHGAIFKLAPNAKQTKWKISLVYSFCLKSDCADGADPYAGLTYQGASSGVPYDGTSPLFGTTSAGGSAGSGTAYQMTLTKKNAKVKAIYNFCSQTNCTDGYFPEAGLTMDANGNLFGTTDSGGAPNSGTAFELSPQGGGGYAQTTLYTFCSQTNCADGTRPDYTLAMDGNGDLYGSTQVGGSNNHGVVFKIHPNGTQSTETVAYSFCTSGNCLDGFAPIGPLTVDANGDILGTTQDGGTNFGTIFKLHGSSESVLYNFCQENNCNDGAAPYGGIVLDSSGNMYGTTITGGANDGNGGVVFEFKP